MKKDGCNMRFWVITILLLGVIAVLNSLPLMAAQDNGEGKPSKTSWWDVVPEDEAKPPYDTAIPYSEIAPRLREIQKSSNRVAVQVIGQSAGGRNLFLVTISAPGSSGRYGHIKSLRQMMIRDPEKAQEKLDQFKDFKVPVFINGSIHGNEYEGTDACMQLIETLAFDNSDEIEAILDSAVILINVVQNPDGRVLGIRPNAAKVDLNRDFITQSQPETRATVSVVTEWNPMIFLDLHDDVDPMLIEPCTPPHNPNYEYDLYIRWAFAEALAMEAELFEQTGFLAQIPFRDWDLTWDDWPPIYGAMYPMFHGAYGHTLETPYEDEWGVAAHYAAVWGALKFVADNKKDMVKDQIEIFRRGFLAMPQVLIPAEILNLTPYDQYNELTIKEFPAAYVIPADKPRQLSSHQPARLIDFLLFNDVQVEKATQAFEMYGISYPKGTYVIWMDQPKRGLANTILEDGMDSSDIIEGLRFYAAPTAWSLPLLWGVSRAVMQEKMDIETESVQKAAAPAGSIPGSSAAFYAYLPTSLAAFKATNSLLDRGVLMYRAPKPLENDGQTIETGTFIVSAGPDIANELAGKWALEVFSLDSLPEGVTPMQKRRIAVSADEGVAICLGELGFDYDSISTGDLNNGKILEYDVFLNRNQSWPGNLSKAGKAALKTFFANGGDYIGLLRTGVDFAAAAELMAPDYDRNGSADAILHILYDPNDSLAAGFRNEGYAYVLAALWFTALPEGTQIAASIADGDFLAAGFWEGWQTSSARNKPVVIHQDNGLQDTTLIGIDATFRGHPKNTFRLIGNAIFDGLD